MSTYEVFYRADDRYQHTTVVTTDLTRVEEIMHDFYGLTVAVLQVIEVDQ